MTLRPYDMSIHTNPDAMAWTRFFRESCPDCNVPDDVMHGWFANAMMAMHDYILGAPVVLPDGSAVIVGSVDGDTLISAAEPPQTKELDPQEIEG